MSYHIQITLNYIDETDAGQLQVWNKWSKKAAAMARALLGVESAEVAVHLVPEPNIDPDQSTLFACVHGAWIGDPCSCDEDHQGCDNCEQWECWKARVS